MIKNENMEESFDFHYLYTYDDTEPSHEKDDYALFRLIYGIEWHPSFLVIQEDGSYKIVGEVPADRLL